MYRRCLLGLGLMAAGVVHAAPDAVELARIERLIRYIEQQKDVQFVRNGTAHSPEDAAKFLRDKFKKMGELVTSAQSFIDQIASRSSTTGEPYLIRFPDAHIVPAAQFLTDELRRMDR